ncbi:hypothetical protein MK805_07830 [Shimazuella sp. AN120528]|uniref:hypothetical protein n=1 Tax=Shimazuella soli TaxID=1892854 RepID=UPI001F0E1519|nr:hypothetical protein [Shimazuella soli]MCH5584883.1 hypothetical protein [Shimazuella soli]
MNSVDMDAALNQVIGAMKSGGYKPSEEQIQQLKEILEQATTSSEEQKKKQLKQLLTRIETLRVHGTNVKLREESIKRVREAIANAESLEADTEAVELLIYCFPWLDVSIEIREARGKMENLLRQLESGRTFNTLTPTLNSINAHIRRLTSSLRKALYS